MTDRAAIDGSYADFKLVKTRSVCQLVVEIPIERAEEAIRKFGIPQPGQEIAVALARLEAPPKAVANAERSEKGKERYREADEWQRALMRACAMCDDPRFQEWLARRIGKQYRVDLPNGNRGIIAGNHLRSCLNLTTRADIASNGEAFRAFVALETEYKQATGQFAEERG